jgi:hypothetical protein
VKDAICNIINKKTFSMLNTQEQNNATITQVILSKEVLEIDNVTNGIFHYSNHSLWK